MYDSFQKFGRILKTTIVYDRITGHSKGFGFICFDNIDQANKAIKSGRGMLIDGKNVIVKYSFVKESHEKTPGKYFGNQKPQYLYGNRNYDDNNEYNSSTRRRKRRRIRSYDERYDRNEIHSHYSNNERHYEDRYQQYPRLSNNERHYEDRYQRHPHYSNNERRYEDKYQRHPHYSNHQRHIDYPTLFIVCYNCFQKYPELCNRCGDTHNHICDGYVYSNGDVKSFHCPSCFLIKK